MKRRSKTIVRAARMLTSADPVFVSHVRHGANQTPFQSVKTEDAQLAVRGRTQEADMTTKTGKKPAAQQAQAAKAAAAKESAAKRVRVRQAAPEGDAQGKPEIASIFFPIENFPTEASVKDYLKTNNYAVGDVTIEPDAMGFVAKGHEQDQFDGDLKEIPFEQDGIVLTVGFLKADATSKLATADAGDQGEGAADPGEQPAADAVGAEGGGEGDGQGDAAQAAAADPAETAASDAAGEQAADAGAANDAGAEEGAEQVAAAAENTPVHEDDVPPLAEAIEKFDAALAAATAGLDTIQSLEVTDKDAEGSTKKFDTIVDVLNYMDDLPPGFGDLMYAFSIVCRSAMHDKDYPRISKGANEMADYIVTLAELFAAKEGATKTETNAEAEAREKGNMLRNLILRGLSKKPTASAAPPAQQEQPAATPEAKSAAQPAAVTAADEEPTDPVLKAIHGLGKRLDAMDQRIEQVAAAPAATKGSTSRAQPARKGEGDVDAAPVDPVPAVKSRKFIDNVPEDRLLRNTLGLPMTTKR